jgi:pyridoxine 4-dehydrogenase
VSRIGLGAMRMMKAGPEQALALLRRAAELGVNLIDTADVYGRDGANERVIAESLHPYPSDLVIATKGGQVMVDGKPKPDGRPEHLRAACEASLQRLRLDEIALYQLHNADPAVPLDESLGALDQLRAEGKIRFVGVCNLFGERLARAIETVEIASVQNRYSLLDRSNEDDLRLCESRGIAFLAYAPLGVGAVVGNPMLSKAAHSHEATAAQIALAWLLQQSSVAVAIPGTSSIEHLEENAAASGITLTKEEMTHLASSC